MSSLSYLNSEDDYELPPFELWGALVEWAVTHSMINPYGFFTLVKCAVDFLP